MSQPCIITAAITGSVPRKENNPAVPITVSEQIAGRDLNGDADMTDLVLTFRDRETGQQIPIGEGCPAPGCPEGRAITAVHQPPFAFPALATDGDVAAFLEPEQAQGEDLQEQDKNLDGDVADTILRLYRREASGAVELTSGLHLAVDADTLVNGRSLAVSGGRVFSAPAPYIPSMSSGAPTGSIGVPGGPLSTGPASPSYVVPPGSTRSTPGSTRSTPGSMRSTR